MQKGCKNTFQRKQDLLDERKIDLFLRNTLFFLMKWFFMNKKKVDEFLIFLMNQNRNISKKLTLKNAKLCKGSSNV